MNINATLIIQACNFFIAYLMLRILFFKPVMALIRQEQAQLDGLTSQLNEKRKMIHSLEQSKQEQWRAAQQQFCRHFPDVMASDLSIFKNLIIEREIMNLGEQHIKQLEDELVAQIIEKVEHARS